jgi:Ser/Thr protein kinase RdoA (MazF antagonist)
VAEVRRRLVDDQLAEQLIAKFQLRWAAGAEDRSIQVKWACLHGDLHAGNILINEDEAPILIDFGDVGDGPAWAAQDSSRTS